MLSSWKVNTSIRQNIDLIDAIVYLFDYARFVPRRELADAKEKVIMATENMNDSKTPFLINDDFAVNQVITPLVSYFINHGIWTH